MKLKQIIFYSLFTCVGFSSLSLILSAQIPLIHKLGFSLGLVFVFLYHQFGFQFPRWVFNSLAIFALVSTLIYGIWFAEFPIQSAIYFLGYLLLLRMFELETPRDAKFTLLLSLFGISAGSLMMVQFRYFIIFLGWFFSALFSLSLITISAGSSFQKPLLAKSRLFSLLFSAGIFSIIFGFFLFFFLPRIGLSLLRFPIGPSRNFRGFSSEVRLGEMNELLENQTPVLRGRLLDHLEPIPDLKWRMRAMEYYEDNSWREQNPRFSSFPVYYNQPSTISLSQRPGLKLTQEIYLEPGIGPELPAVGRAYAYLLPYKFRNFLCSENDYCTLPYPSSERIHYLAYSVLPEYSEEEIKSALSLLSESRKEGQTYEFDQLLQLPQGSEPICQLAEEILGKEPDPVKKLSVLKNFFEHNFRYSLRNLPTGKNPLEDFLFKSRRGNCEYFASASVIMLRCLGIPSRLAVGFISGEWNPYQNYYLVRERDAHAWVEVFLPGLGFMEYDPTPPGARTEQRKSSWWWKVVDPMVFRWNRWIVEYSVQDQVQGWRRIEAESYRLRYRLRWQMPELKFWLKSKPELSILIIVLGAGAIFFSFWFNPRRKRERVWLKNLTPAQKEAVKIYLEMRRILRKILPDLPVSFTGLELAESAPLTREAKEMIRKITDFYYQIRFGRSLATAENFKQAQAQLLALKKSLGSGR